MLYNYLRIKKMQKKFIEWLIFIMKILQHIGKFTIDLITNRTFRNIVYTICILIVFCVMLFSICHPWESCGKNLDFIEISKYRNTN